MKPLKRIVSQFLSKSEPFFNIFLNFYLLTLVFLFFCRVAEIVGVIGYRDFPIFYSKYSLMGFLQDMVQLGALFFVLIVPAYLIKALNGKFFLFIMKSISILLVFIQLFLTLYFLEAYVPLDRVVFSYSPAELIKIIETTSSFHLYYLIPFIVVVGSVWLLIKYNPISLNKFLKWALLVVIFISLLISPKELFRSSSFSNPMKYYISANKTSYFIKSIGKEKTDTDIRKVAEFQRINPERNYVDINYPLLYSREKEQSSLFPYFSLKEKKPNIVFIVMESLGSRYSGRNAELGSFTPFLDSLASVSLYWPHALSTSERTINALPSVFGSLPYGKEGFTFASDSCLHFSLISLLIKNGYDPSFFYGGGIRFDMMYNFLRDQGIESIVGHDFYKSADGTVFWGINDNELYKEGLSTISRKTKKPRLDIFLTLSTHGPWDYPDIPKFEAKADRLFKQYHSPKELVENTVIRSDLSSLIFADSTLRELFSSYQKREDYGNTIFIITGDHEYAHTLPKNRFDLYQVPLIIYSPLIKKPAEFKPIVTHLDITPSILNLLDKQYQLVRPQYEHWLGTDLDTSSSFRSTRKLGFLCIDRLINDFLYNDVLLLNNDIYKVNPDLSLTLLDNQKEKQEMENYRDYFRNMNLYSTSNKIVSPVVYNKYFK